MFKALILSLAMLPGLGHSAVINTTPIENLNGGLVGSPSGALTYALNNALTGTASSAIDLSGTVGLWISITSTAISLSGVTNNASSVVNVYFSNSNVTYTAQMYQIQGPGSYAITPKARYVTFVQAGSAPTNRVSLSYYNVVAPTGTFTGTFSNGTVTAYPGVNPWPVTGTVTDALAYGNLTTTAYGTAGRGGSYTAVALTSAYSMNITFAAGVNAPVLVTIYPGNGPNASFYWNSMPGWLAPSTAVAVSSTPIMFTAGIGDFLNLSVTGAALSVTAQVRYAPIY